MLYVNEKGKQEKNNNNNNNNKNKNSLRKKVNYKRNIKAFVANNGTH